MPLIRLISKIFFFPGDLVLKFAGITIEEDSGILRSFINMSFWGFFAILYVVNFA